MNLAAFRLLVLVPVIQLGLELQADIATWQ